MRNMLIAITDKGDSVALMERLRAKGAGGGTVLHGRGTASRTFLSLLGLGEAKKDILISLLEGPDTGSIIDEAKSFRSRGAVFTIREESDMEEKWRLIEVIVEKGYMEDVMAVARKAGARGGTVINGHGTANQDDVMFCGIHLVPEKEVLLIVAEEKTSEEVMKKVGEMKCLREKGMGIMFSVPVSDFKVLGS